LADLLAFSFGGHILLHSLFGFGMYMMLIIPILIGEVAKKTPVKINPILKMKKEKRAVTLYKRNAG
jgi:hypothetical protein